MLAEFESNLQAAGAGDRLKPGGFRELIQQGREHIYAEFDAGVGAEQLVRDTAGLIDSVLRFCFAHFIGKRWRGPVCLVAVGGYGSSCRARTST